jgi:DNA polymerase I-like protein with 3'-5' exonuclease and polymerase domains
MENPKKDKVIPVPDYTLPPLSLVEKTGSIIGHNGVTFIAGEGIKPADIMFISSCVSPQEASKFIKGKYNEEGVRVRPRYLRSDAGVMFSDIFNQEGIDLYKCYYTALVKWLLPKNERIKIPKDVVAWALPALEAEIQSVNPKIIVCIGKPVFDLLTEIKLSLSDAKSGWFYNKKYNAKLYLIDDTYELVTNPEYIGKFRVEAREIHRMHREVCNLATDRIPLEYETITNSADLKRVVSNWKQNNFNVISVDCEWAGNNHIDGQLRSTQFCWAPGKACYVRWMDDKGNYTFDTSYKEAGSILSSWLDREEVKYIGHHFAADAPWLHHVLGLNWYEKCIFDTEFAQQTANEAEDLSLERIALKYTDLGRYDLDLVLWVKQNKALMADGGYGAIPDDILIPYACKDVDTVFRAWPFIHRSLQIQDLLDYYNNVFHPFVTDVFVSFAVVGLPMDVAMMDELRVLYTFARDKMEVVLREDIHVEAKNFILMAFATRLPPELAANSYLEFISLIANSDHAQAWSILKSAAKKPDDVPKLKFIFDHFVDSANFNIRSAAHLKRWLFQVKGYEPIKSTNNKDKGLPATSWEKIKAMPLDVQKNYNPAVDKQTLQILSEQNDDRILRKLLQLNAVGNICKAFLKEADTDADGNVLKENGLHFYLCSDNRVHGQMSTTETGRPRSWKPNSLNWPSYVNSMISSGISDLFGKLKERGELPEEFEKFIIKDDKGDYKIKVPSIRSCVKAPDDWCFVESDYQTAEIRGLAFISGDKNLIDIVCNPDLNFAVTKDDKKVRLSFPSEVFPPSAQEEHKSLLISPDDPSLMKKEDGSLKHPKQDLHWSLAEMVHIKPREVLDEKKDRGAAKVGNFCVAENELVLTHNGLKPIQHVSDCDLLWDGVEWVSHEGVVYSGEKEVIEYQGLRATKLHDVWANKYGKVKFGEAKSKQLELIRSEETCCSFEHTRIADINRYSREERRRLFFRMDALQTMRRRKAERFKKYGKGVFSQVPVPKPPAYYRRNTRRNQKSTTYPGIALSSNGAALLQRHACVIGKIQDARHKSRVRFSQGILSVGSADLAGRVFRKERFRPYRQCRQLFQNKFKVGRSHDEFVESRLYARNSYRACSKIYGAVSKFNLYRKNCFRFNSLRVVCGGNTEQTCAQPKSRLAKVYDIINAGPRNRFTCQGVLVSNSSAYGASASTLERKIEQDTGKKPEEGTGQRLLKALEKRQPVAQDFLIKMERVPEKPGYYRAASGRLRHFSSHDPKYIDEIDEQLTMGLFRSMGREARNFPMQESVAATAARAGKWLLDAYIKLGMQARPLIILYDSVVTLCPLEERFKVAQLHQLFMTDENTWTYHGRTMNYPIDQLFCYRWSDKPSKDETKLLEDKTYKTN